MCTRVSERDVLLSSTVVDMRTSLFDIGEQINNFGMGTVFMPCLAI